MSGAKPTASASSPSRACFSPQASTSRRTASRSRSWPGAGQGELVGRLPCDRRRYRQARGLGEAGRRAGEGLAARQRADAADPGDVRRRGLCHPGCVRVGPAAPAGELGSGRRRRPAAAHGGGGQGPRPGHGAAALGVQGGCRWEAARAAGLVGRHAGRQGRAVPLAEARVADGGGAGGWGELSAWRLPLPAIRRGVLSSSSRPSAWSPGSSRASRAAHGRRSPGGATRPSTAASTPGPRPRSMASTGSRNGTGSAWRRHWRGRSSGMMASRRPAPAVRPPARQVIQSGYMVR